MKNKSWTIIIQISGENNLLLDSISAYNEIAKTGSTDEINFVAIMDRMEFIGDFSENYSHLEYLKNKNLAFPSVYLITKNIYYSSALPEKIFNNDDLYDSKNRDEIYIYIKKKFPANNFGFIYKGHGQAGGTDVGNTIMITKIFKVEKDEYTSDGKIKDKKIEKRISLNKNNIGKEYEYSEFFKIDDEELFPRIVLAIFCKKTADDNYPFLTYSKLQESLKNVFEHKGLAFVLLDACWGMQMENIHQFKDTTEYLVASPDEMPAIGIGYKYFCEFVTKNEEIKPNELAKMLVAVFYTQRFNDYNDLTDVTYKKMGVSLSCVHTESYLTKVLIGFKGLTEYLKKNIDKYTPSISRSISNCKDFTYSNPHVYKIYNLDFTWFLENLIHYNKNDEKLQILCYQLLLNIRLYLISSFTANNYKETKLGERFIGGKGLSITLPKNKSWLDLSAMSKEFPDKINFFSETCWREFLEKYFENFEKNKALFNQHSIGNTTINGNIPLLNDISFSEEINSDIESKWIKLEKSEE